MSLSSPSSSSPRPRLLLALAALLCLWAGWACTPKKPAEIPAAQPAPLSAPKVAAELSGKPPQGGVAPEVAPAQNTEELPTWPDLPRVRVVLVGDTGEPGPALETIRAAIAREPDKTLILALGDLIYPIAPACEPGPLDADHLQTLQTHVGAALEGLGAPVFLVLGNHDTGNFHTQAIWRSPAREACMIGFAAQHPDLYLPSANLYHADLGPVRLLVSNTNALTQEDGTRAQELVAQRPEAWFVLAGHHVLKTYHDKEGEDFVAPWLRAHGLRPDLYTNGHAHFLQFGVYDQTPALTSGSGSKLRDRPSCPPECGPGQLWGQSMYGYAVLEADAQTLQVTFKDARGLPLWSWSRSRAKGP